MSEMIFEINKVETKQGKRFKINVFENIPEKLREISFETIFDLMDTFEIEKLKIEKMDSIRYKVNLVLTDIPTWFIWCGDESFKDAIENFFTHLYYVKSTI